MQPELMNLLTLERQSPLANGDCSVNLTLLDLTSMIIICLFNELRYFFSVPVFQKGRLCQGHKYAPVCSIPGTASDGVAFP